MREYGQVQCAFWIDPELQSLSDEAVLLAVYLMTGPHSNGLGCYRVPDGYIQADRGWTPGTIKKAFGELSRKGFAYRCESTGFVIMPAFLRWNPITNANVATAREREFGLVPKTFEHYSVLVQSLIEHGKHWGKGFLNHLETLCEGFGEGYGKQEHDPDHDPEQDQEEESAEQDSPPPDDPVVVLIPLNTGDEFPVTESKARELAELYPAVDVPQALRNMRGWCLANPRRRKTKSGVLDFITSWLARDQNRGPARPPAKTQGHQRRGGFQEIDYDAEAREAGFREVI